MGKRKTHKTAEVDWSFLFADFHEAFMSSEQSGFFQHESGISSLNLDDYLQKGEKLFSLAREKFERVFKDVSLSDADEKIFSTLPLETDTLYDIVCRVKKCYTRPLLCSMKSVDDEYFVQLMKSVDISRIRVEVEFAGNEVLRMLRKLCKEPLEPNAVCLKVTLYEEGYHPIVACGLKDIPHSQRYKNGVFNNIDICCADMGDFFSYLIVYKYIMDVLTNIFSGNANMSDSTAHRAVECIHSHATQFIERCVHVFPEECKTTYQGCSLKDILALPVNFCLRSGEYAAKPFLDTLDACGVSYVNHPRQRELQSSMRNLSDKAAPQVYLGMTTAKDLPFYVADKIRLPYHALLTADFQSAGRYYPIPICKKSSAKHSYEPFKFKLLADLFRIIADDRCSKKQVLSYYRELAQSYAKSYMLKKELTTKVKKAMESSLFNRYFGFVEFDVETDLTKVAEIEKEFLAVKEKYLSNVDSSKNAIRFRKLGQHKALGLYYPSLACLCVDIHSPSSLIHEYGHLIDYTYEGLSRQYEFAHIRKMYATSLNNAMKKDQALAKRMKGNGKYNRSYYLTPTEIFARCFELYISKCLGVVNSIVPSDFPDTFAYPLEDDFLNAVKMYFDSLDLCNKETTINAFQLQAI